MGSPSILAQTTSQDSIQKTHSVAEKIKDDSKITPKALVRDYSRAKNQVESLEARLIQEEKQCQRLQSEIEAYAKKLSLKDNEIHNANQQLNSMESAVTKLQSEKANLLCKLMDRDIREKEEKAAHDRQISALHSKVENMETHHHSLQIENDSLHLEWLAWNKEKSHLVDQNNAYLQTISNIQKKVHELESAQQ
ncbi:hypothetical protein DSO57_1035327 [Entomophthora muscae]|uniref:Uncharacterized protein n=1 Tax=Entomophthora muscae TaxID=34485 RepID=A0ACC2TA89_9FUNG|nr:hypothetical protein DSO57_1035327 [Entomophthora muscae]